MNRNTPKKKKQLQAINHSHDPFFLLARLHALKKNKKQKLHPLQEILPHATIKLHPGFSITGNNRRKAEGDVQ